MRHKQTIARFAGVAVGAILLSGLVACTNSDEPADAADTNTSSESSEVTLGKGGREAAEAVKQDPAVAALVPEALRQKGTLKLVTDPTYAPIDFTDDAGNIIGVEPDFALATANKMGLKIDNGKADFNGIIAGLESNRYDASWAAFSITPDRTAVVDMVSFMNAGTAIMTKKGEENGIKKEEDLCGLTIAVQTGTTQALEVMPKFEQMCKDKGLKAITPLVVPQQDSANQSVSSGRAQAMIADNALVAYYAQVKPTVYAAVPGILVEPALIGVAMPRINDSKLAEAYRAAIQSLIDDGTYQEILDSWSLGNTALETAKINPKVG
ncbi:ABC transporter substrate-binding protein [Leucobacter coleopterorum]|uniref:ABC transporter substrate-binding protein n=1 Tax=Leucobacter coleopterorum TaxID=2714933 RepID=A0ABX6JTD9_9MICO|nr:ABC transporter substrate-binding protein [Leucobacter coleopterorum]QIM17562.1 ABC transporter substrate-binding protein [Leucobacter coleopterorum]